MFKFTDNFVEQKLKILLHRDRQDIIEQTIAEHVRNHPNSNIEDLRTRLEVEADRTYNIIDRSILRERIIRSRYTFWATVMVMLIIFGSLGTFSAGNVATFITPVLSAFVTWLTSLATIPVSYHQRIKGAMDSITFSFEHPRPQMFSQIQELHEIKLENDSEHSRLNIEEYSSSSAILVKLELTQTNPTIIEPQKDNAPEIIIEPTTQNSSEASAAAAPPSSGKSQRRM